MNKDNSIIETVQKWETFLRSNPNNFLKIMDVPTQRFIKGGNKKNAAFFQWQDVLVKGHDSLGPWFDALILDNGLSEILVQFKRLNGSSSIHIKGMPMQKYNVEPRSKDLTNAGSNPVSRAQENSIMPKPETQDSPLNIQHPNNMGMHPNNMNVLAQQSLMHMGGLGAAAGAAGLGYRELVDLEKKSEQSDFYKSEMERYRKENDILVIDNRDLKSKVDNANVEKNLAIKEANLNQKNWADNPAILKLIETAGPIMEATFSKNGAAVTPQLGMGAAALSEPKKRFVEFLTDPESTDERVTLLESVMVIMIQNPEFENVLGNIIEQQKTANETPGS